MLLDLLSRQQRVKPEAQTTPNQLLIQCDAALGSMWYITWLGTLWNRAVPDLMSELGSVVVHVDHIDHNVNRVFYLVAVEVHCMSSQLKETQTHLGCGTVQATMIFNSANIISGQNTNSALNVTNGTAVIINPTNHH